jgi:hypothetical protein
LSRWLVINVLLNGTMAKVSKRGRFLLGVFGQPSLRKLQTSESF